MGVPPRLHDSLFLIRRYRTWIDGALLWVGREPDLRKHQRGCLLYRATRVR